MGIEYITDRQGRFAVEYLASLINFLTSLHTKNKMDKKAEKIAKEIEAKFGIKNEKEAGRFSVAKINGMSDEELAQTLDAIGIQRADIRNIDGIGLTCVLGNDDFIKLSQFVRDMTPPYPWDKNQEQEKQEEDQEQEKQEEDQEQEKQEEELEIEPNTPVAPIINPNPEEIPQEDEITEEEIPEEDIVDDEPFEVSEKEIKKPVGETKPDPQKPVTEDMEPEIIRNNEEELVEKQENIADFQEEDITDSKENDLEEEEVSQEDLAREEESRRKEEEYQQEKERQEEARLAEERRIQEEKQAQKQFNKEQDEVSEREDRFDRNEEREVRDETDESRIHNDLEERQFEEKEEYQQEESRYQEDNRQEDIYKEEIRQDDDYRSKDDKNNVYDKDETQRNGDLDQSYREDLSRDEDLNQREKYPEDNRRYDPREEIVSAQREQQDRPHQETNIPPINPSCNKADDKRDDVHRDETRSYESNSSGYRKTEEEKRKEFAGLSAPPAQNGERTFSVNRIDLNHAYRGKTDDTFIVKSGELAAAGAVMGIKDTGMYKGYREVTEIAGGFRGTIANISNKSSLSIHNEKMHKDLLNGDMASYNGFMKSKGFNAASFGSKLDAKNANLECGIMLSKNGLATMSKDGKNFDFTAFNKMMKEYKKGNTIPLIKALGFKAGTNPAEIKKTIASLEKMVKGVHLNSAGFGINKKKAKNFWRKKITKGLQENEAYKGYVEVQSAITTGKTAFMLFKKAKRKANTLTKKGRIRNAKKDAKIAAKDAKKLNKALSKYNKKMDRRKRIINRLSYRKGKMTTFGKAVDLKRKVMSKVITPIMNRIASSLLFHLFNALVKALAAAKLFLLKFAAIALLVLFLLSFIVALGMMFSTSIFDLFAPSAPDGEEVYDSQMKQNLKALQEMEEDWIDELKNEDRYDYLPLNSFTYGIKGLSIEEYCNQEDKNYIYDSSTCSVLGPNPFGEKIILSEDKRTKIYNITGATEVIYQNVDGQHFRTSNIKEILSMASVFFDNTTEYEEWDEEACYIEKMFVSVTNKAKMKTNLSTYVETLFNVTHISSFDIEPVIRPTAKTIGSMEGDEGLLAEIDVLMCPAENGCVTGDFFFYDDNNRLIVYDIDEAPCDVSAYVHPLDSSCTFSNGFNMDIYAQNQNCYYISVTDGPNITVLPANVDGNSALANDARAINGEIEGISGVYATGGVSTASATGYSKTFTDTIKHEVTRQEYKMDEDGNVILENGNPVIIWVTETVEESVSYKKTYNISIERQCNGDHKGSYCGGHLNSTANAFVCGFSQAQLGGEIDPPVEQGEYTHVGYSKTEFTGDYNDFYDIIQKDSETQHKCETEAWQGWTEGNIQLAILRYEQDWEEFYGIAMPSVVGGKPLTQDEIRTIVYRIQEAYPDTPEGNLEAITRALGYVGRMGYSQAHHGCPLDGPCKSGSLPCTMNDCSGFVSGIYSEQLKGEVYTVQSFYDKFGGTLVDPSRTLDNVNPDLEPGDILLSLPSKDATGSRGNDGDNHALIYLGCFQKDIGEEIGYWMLDCTSQTDEITGAKVGGVYLRNYWRLQDCRFLKVSDLS